jgi:hypothetical protein
MYVILNINTSIRQYVNTSIHQYVNTSIRQYINTSIHQYINTSMSSGQVNRFYETLKRNYSNKGFRAPLKKSVIDVAEPKSLSSNHVTPINEAPDSKNKFDKNYSQSIN